MSFLGKVLDAVNPINVIGSFIYTPPTVTIDQFLEAVATGNKEIVQIGLKSLKSLDPKDFESTFKWEWRGEASGGRSFRGCIKEYTKCNALVIAGLSNQKDILELILKDPKGIKLLNLVDENGWTPLHFLAKKTDTQFAILQVCEAGAEINVLNSGGYTPLDLAAYGNPEAVKTLLIYMQLKQQTLSGTDLSLSLKMALLYTNIAGYTSHSQESISVLLEHEADPRVKIYIDDFSGNLIEYANYLELSHAIIKMLEEQAKRLDASETQKKLKVAETEEKEKSDKIN